MKTTYALFNPLKGEKAPDPVRPEPPDPFWKIDHVTPYQLSDGSMCIIWTWSTVSELLDRFAPDGAFVDKTDVFFRDVKLK